MSSPVVRRLLLLTMIVCCLLVIPPTSAKPLKPKVDLPETYGEAMFGIKEVRENVAEVQCGGWAPDSNATTNNGTVTGHVPLPTITGLPGRANSNANALAKTETGLGQRDSFEYPSDAYGFVSDCDINTKEYFDRDLHAGDSAAVPPVSPNMALDFIIDPDGTARIVPGTGKVHVNPHEWCMLSKPEFATPKYCKRLFDAWMYFKQHAPRPDPLSDMFCPIDQWIIDAGVWSPEALEKTYCFDFTKECRGEECRTMTEGNVCDSQKRPNSVRSEFTECKVSRDAAGNITAIEADGGAAAGTPSPSSFYRHYTGTFGPLPPPADAKAEAPTKTWKLRGDCYDYYREDDPKECITNPTYDQCELTIATPSEQNPDTPEWPAKKDPQGKIVNDQKGVVSRSFPATARPPRTVPDPWKADAGSSLILIDTEKLEQIQQGFEDPLDILPILGTPLPVRQIGGAATTPDHGFTDMFDDADFESFGAEPDGRAVSRFWETQQKELLKMVQDPQTKLVMPARFLVGLSDDDPLFQYVRGAVSRPNGIVEMTIRAGAEDIGNLLVSLSRMYVAPLQEVRIPLIVPLASVAEIDARIFDWEQWKKREDKRYEAELADGITNNPSRAVLADPLIQKLKDYKTGIEKVRLLRGALPNYLKKLLAPEQEIRGYVADWYRQNAAILLQSAQRSLQRKELKDLWRQIQQAMLVTDECQLLWCSNQRYSLPIYSLLDQWWGVGGSTRDHQYKPRDLSDLRYEPPNDHEFDFSDMKFPRDPLLIPVLWPVQVQLKLPVPPLVGGKPPSVSEFPDIPWIPDASIFDSFPVPTVDLPRPPVTLTAPTMPDLSQAITIMQEFRSIVGGGEQTPVYDRVSMQGAYCRFPRSITIPPNIDVGNPDRIVHVENDLNERAARLFARWMPNRQEDLAGRAVRLQREFPSPRKPDCREDILCFHLLSEEWRKISWQWLAPFGSPDFDPLMNKLEKGDSSAFPPHTGTLPTNEATNPYAATLLQLQSIFEGMSLPTIINLLAPPRPAPPSSSTP